MLLKLEQHEHLITVPARLNVMPRRDASWHPSGSNRNPIKPKNDPKPSRQVQAEFSVRRHLQGRQNAIGLKRNSLFLIEPIGRRPPQFRAKIVWPVWPVGQSPRKHVIHDPYTRWDWPPTGPGLPNLASPSLNKLCDLHRPARVRPISTHRRNAPPNIPTKDSASETSQSSNPLEGFR